MLKKHNFKDLAIILFSHEIVFLEKFLSEDSHTVEKKAGLAFREGKEEDFADFIQMRGSAYAEDIINRFRKGDIPFVLESVPEGSILGYHWIANKHYGVPEMGWEFRSLENDVYLYDAYVRSDYRNAGVLKQLNRETFRLLKQEKKERLFLYTLSNNAASLSSVKKMGFKEYKRYPFTWKYKWKILKNFISIFRKRRS